MAGKPNKKNPVLKKKWKVYRLFGISIDALTVEDLHDYILDLVKEKRHEYLLNVNINCFNLINSNTMLKKMFQRSTLTFLDGDGVRLGLRFLGKKSPPKITYDRWIRKFAEFSERENLSWYLLGDQEHINKKAKDNLLAGYPALKIVGAHHGFFNLNDSEKIVEDIKACKPDILLLGMGMPKQELWLMKNWVKVPDVHCALTGGAVLKYLSGEARSTPYFFYKLKLEWFYRFIHEPRRLFKRYFIGNIMFFVRLFLCKFGVRGKTSRREIT